MKFKLLGFGWKSKISLKRVTYYISINKLVAEGCCLEKGKEIHSYLAEDETGRKALIIYMDGKKADKTKR
ncbi:MAG: hypothetical protein AABX54_02635 [Nanoarchaeota archaeon]